MGRERALHFDGEDAAPSHAQVRAFLVDYCGAAAERIYMQRCSGRRIGYIVVLVGAPSRATRRVMHHTRASRWIDPDVKSRWIEVFFYAREAGSALPDYGIITRDADEFTNDIADGIATRLARAYGGRMEPDG